MSIDRLRRFRCRNEPPRPYPLRGYRCTLPSCPPSPECGGHSRGSRRSLNRSRRTCINNYESTLHLDLGPYVSKLQQTGSLLPRLSTDIAQHTGDSAHVKHFCEHVGCCWRRSGPTLRLCSTSSTRPQVQEPPCCRSDRPPLPASLIPAETLISRRSVIVATQAGPDLGARIVARSRSMTRMHLPHYDRRSQICRAGH